MKMAPTEAHPSIQIGNCEVTVGAKRFSSVSQPNCLQISFSRTAKIKISVKERETHGVEDDCAFVLVNSKDSDCKSNRFLQQVVELYSEELPAMNYAANTGKQSMFLEKCVFNGRYSTLILKYNGTEGSSLPGEVVAAITFQIVPTDTKYAEIPLTAVKSVHQHKGFGRFLYMELMKRLQNVGIHTVYCWGDKESEGFWIKQGFTSIAQVNKKGKAQRLPIKAGMRKALCYPGGSTLMVCHPNNATSVDPSDPTKLCVPLKINSKPFLADYASDRPALTEGTCDVRNSQYPVNFRVHDLHCTKLMTAEISGCSQGHDSMEHIPFGRGEYSKTSCAELPKVRVDTNGGNDTSGGIQGTKRRAWEASLSSLKSKKVKGIHHVSSDSDFVCSLDSQSDRLGSYFHACSLTSSKSCCFVEAAPMDALRNKRVEDAAEEGRLVNMTSEAGMNKEIEPTGNFRIMLMNIANDTKKSHLTEVIRKLGGSVTSDGISTTHVVSGKVRRTLNFCTALCSGSWVVSSSWLKESFRKGKFVDELPHLLRDEEYEHEYGIELKDAILRAKAKPGTLLKGYNICIAPHIQPPVKTLSAIVRSAGANVIDGVDEVDEGSRTIFIACEEDMEEAIIAGKKGIWSFSSEWLMNCIMRQHLDLEAQQFAESL